MASLCTLLALTACGRGEAIARTSAREIVQGELDQLATLTVDVCNKLPAATAAGWSADDPAIADAKVAWKAARAPQARINGVIWQLNEDDAAFDGTYEQAIAEGPDDNAFDTTGFTGGHAVERILFSDETPRAVQEAEAALDHGAPSRFPSTENEAAGAIELCNDWAAQAIAVRDAFSATDGGAPLIRIFRGATDQISDHKWRLQNKVSQLDESRYAQHSLADLRLNVAGSVMLYSAFESWVYERGGTEDNVQIKLGLGRLQELYAGEDEALPDAPTTWVLPTEKQIEEGIEPEQSEADLESDFGALYEGAAADGDVEVLNSPASGMNRAALIMGFPKPEPAAKEGE